MMRNPDIYVLNWDGHNKELCQKHTCACTCKGCQVMCITIKTEQLDIKR